MKKIGCGIIALLALNAVLIGLGLGVLAYQGKQAPKTDSPYVALGSSYAAGIGLGPRQPGSPLVCMRSGNGYPQQLARSAGLSLTDMTCSGATDINILRGGQVFLGPQIDAIGPDTTLVTLTAGGNDIGYIRDMIALSQPQHSSFVRFVARLSWHGAKPAQDRDFGQLKNNMAATVSEIMRRAPHARVLVVPYLTVLPPSGTCPQVAIGDADATLMRGVAAELAEVTREAAQASGATFVDMASLSVGHDACSAVPWVNGAAPAQGVPFHPTLAGAQATAQAIMLVLNEKQ